MRDELWADLKQPDSRAANAAYLRLVANISNPVSAELVRRVRGSKSRQVCLNAIILWRRAFWLIFIAIVFWGIIESWWFLILIPLVWVTNNLVLNHVQTSINVELAARLFLLHVMTDEDPAFRNQVLGPPD